MTARPLRLLSLNLWDLPVPLPLHDRGARRAAFLAELARLNPDLVLLQESFRPAFRRVIARALPAHHGPSGYDRRRRFLGLPMDRTGGLFTLSRWEMNAVSYEPATWFRGLKLDERIGGKGCLWTAVHAPGGVILVGNVHLYAGTGPRDGCVRARQARDVLDSPRLAGNGAPVILGGDFNWDHSFERCDREATGLARVTAAGFHEVADHRSDGLRTMDPASNRYARYIPGERPPRRLTHVYYRGDALTVAAPPRLCFTNPPVSDHYGLLVELAAA